MFSVLAQDLGRLSQLQWTTTVTAGLVILVAAGVAPFATWVPVGEAIGRSKSEKLELYLKVLYELLRDILLLHEGTGEIRNQDIRRELEGMNR